MSWKKTSKIRLEGFYCGGRFKQKCHNNPFVPLLHVSGPDTWGHMTTLLPVITERYDWTQEQTESFLQVTGKNNISFMTANKHHHYSNRIISSSI